MAKAQKSGPSPERLRIDGDWEDAVKKALKKGPPPKELKKGETEQPD